MIANRYSGKCTNCSKKLQGGEGYAYKDGYTWKQCCTSTACMSALGQQIPNNKRELSADGKVTMPYDKEAITYLRALPGAKWDPNARFWTCSIKPGDLPRVIEIAKFLNLDIAPELISAMNTGTPEMRKAMRRAEVLRNDGKGLFPFQKEGVKFLSLHKRALLADDMGLGKTVESIASVEEDAAVLVICPAAVKYNWRNEFAIWRPEFKITICDTKDSFILPVPGQVVIMTYSVLPKLLEEDIIDSKVVEQLKSATVIADEFHLAKNYKAARSKRVKGISTHAKVFWALTGTPLMNKAQDLYGILEAGNMKVFSSWTQFVKLFNGAKNQWGGYEFGMPCPEVPEMMKKVMLRRLKSEVLKDLPKKTYKNILVNDIGTDLKKEMDKLLRSEAVNQGIIEDGDIVTPINEIADLLDMDTLPGFSEFSKIRAKLAASRVEAMMEIVESYEDAEIPLVVFSAHRAPIDALNAREGWASITGDTKAEDRTNIVKQFQAGQLKGIALTIQAGGIGITLTRASNALFIDLDWTPALNIQAEDRLNRIGQTADSLLIMRMTSNHVLDQHVNQLLEYKIKLAYEALEHSAEYNQTIQPANVVTEETEEQMRTRMAANTVILRKADSHSTKKYYMSRIDKIAEREANKVSHIPTPTLTPEIKEELRKALDFMDSRCDGAVTKDFVGFNKPDAFIGKWIAKTGLDDSDEKTFRVLERILCRYRQQLSGFNIWQ